MTGAAGYANVPPGAVFGAGAGGQTCPPTIICGPEFVDATPDLSHVVLESQADVALTSTPVPSGGLYEWSADRPQGESLQLVSVLPESEGGGAASEPVLGRKSQETRHAISENGSYVFWSTEAGGGALYLRDMTTKVTLRLDQVQSGAGAGAVQPEFKVASSKGSRVFFTDTQELMSQSGKGDLYECVIVEGAGGEPKCELSDLTPATGGESANVDGVLGASEDGSWVYFVADNVLAPGAVPGDCESRTAKAVCDLYVRHGGATRLVAVLSGEDRPDWAFAEKTVNLTSRVSSDGQWLAFMSQQPLTGYDNRDAVSGAPDEEVYLYDGVTGKLVCASCNPTGARPEGEEYTSSGPSHILYGGDAVWSASSWLAANVPTWSEYTVARARYQSRFLSNSGRLFFNSRDPLTPQAVNGTWNVYEYEPPGIGGCTGAEQTFSERSGGCVGLISSGGSAQQSAFLDASESGGDVFFLTTAKLVSQEVEGGFSVYDAHECTSESPCSPPPSSSPPQCTTTDACRAAPSPQPAIFGSPSSATFSGAGNTTPAPAAAAVKPKAKPLTRAQKLAAALRACRKKRKRTRAACEAQARSKYGAKAEAKTHKGDKR